MALKHLTTRRKPYRSTESQRHAVKSKLSRGHTSLAFAQLDPGLPRDLPYLLSVYCLIKCHNRSVFLKQHALQYHSKVSWHSVVSLDSICRKWESRTSYRESSLAEQETKDSPTTDFSIILQKTYSHNTTRHGYIRYSRKRLHASSRPIWVIKQMFLKDICIKLHFLK